MGAAFAGIVRVPLTSVIMVFEITRDYSIIVPLMIANLISYFIASRLQDEPIYEALQHQDGIRLPSGTRARQDLLTVAHAYQTETPVLVPSERIGQAAASVDREYAAWPVIDETGFRGMVTITELDEAMQNGRENTSLAQLIPSFESTEAPLDSLPHVYPDDPLEAAMSWLAGGRIRTIPVLSRLNTRELKGTISLRDVLSAYEIGRTENQEIPAERSSRFPTGLLAGLSATVIAILVAAGLLNHFYRAERSKRAEQYFAAGNEFLQKDRFPEAIEQFRNALSINHSVPHRLMLGLALLKAERTDEALIYLDEVVRERPDNGPANLAIAEANASIGKDNDAILHYQRAIVGSWSSDPEQNRFKAQLQLVDFLQKRGRTSQARAEILALAAHLPTDESSHKQVGKKLISLGLARPAVDLYADLLKSGPPDAEEYDGLGDAQFALANYHGADDAFRSALKIDSSDQHAAHRVEITEKILALDPVTPGIGARERYNRSRMVLGDIADELTGCAGSEVLSRDELRTKVAQVRSVLAERKAPTSFSDAADTNVALSVEIWRARLAACAAPAGDSPLEAIMTKLMAR